MVLDFANEADEIKAAFEPYYETTLLSEATDPNLLYEIQTRLAAFPVYTEADVDAFAKVYFDPKATAGPALRRARAGAWSASGDWSPRGAARLPRPAHRLRAALRLPRPGADLRRRRPREALRLRPAPAPAASRRPSRAARARCSRTSTWSRTGSSRPAAARSRSSASPGVLEPGRHQAGPQACTPGGAGGALPHHRRAERALRAEPRPRAPGDARPDDGEARRRRRRSMPARGSTPGRTCASPSTRRSST